MFAINYVCLFWRKLGKHDSGFLSGTPWCPKNKQLTLKSHDKLWLMMICISYQSSSMSVDCQKSLINNDYWWWLIIIDDYWLMVNYDFWLWSPYWQTDEWTTLVAKLLSRLKKNASRIFGTNFPPLNKSIGGVSIP